ncbi:MAG: hypothetical protein NUV59_02755 [Patescibacteria group bacterium]|nr:hypothetical protein [Patescibacteria group bacterium]
MGKNKQALVHRCDGVILVAPVPPGAKESARRAHISSVRKQLEVIFSEPRESGGLFVHLTTRWRGGSFTCSTLAVSELFF